MLVKVTPNSAIELSISPPYYQEKSLQILLVYTISGNNAVDLAWNEHHTLTVKQLLTHTRATLRFVIGFVCHQAVYIYKVTS